MHTSSSAGAAPLHVPPRHHRRFHHPLCSDLCSDALLFLEGVCCLYCLLSREYHVLHRAMTRPLHRLHRAGAPAPTWCDQYRCCVKMAITDLCCCSLGGSVLFTSIMVRSMLRDHFHISHGGACSDVCTGCCCAPCSACQVFSELEARGHPIRRHGCCNCYDRSMTPPHETHEDHREYSPHVQPRQGPTHHTEMIAPPSPPAMGRQSTKPHNMTAVPPPITHTSPLDTSAVSDRERSILVYGQTAPPLVAELPDHYGSPPP